MDTSDMFYGLPQLVWDELCEKAEDIMHEEEIGQHILGLYPIGPRMYGLETESPEILCIYFGDPERLLNPTKTPYSLLSHPVGHSLGKIHFVDIYNWVKDEGIKNETYRSRHIDLVPAVGSHIIYSDPAMTDISSYMAEHLNLANFTSHQVVEWSVSAHKWLHLRTRFLMSYEHWYVPCINPDWGETLKFSDIYPNQLIPEDIISLDEELRQEALGLVDIDRQALVDKKSQYINWCLKAMRVLPSTINDHSSAHVNAAKEVESLYRSLL